LPHRRGRPDSLQRAGADRHGAWTCLHRTLVRPAVPGRVSGLGLGGDLGHQPTERWDDIKGRAHDRAFIVAGAAKVDLLADLQAELVQRATDGRGLQAFRKEFKAIVAKHGWTGWTGEGSKEGEAWRTRIIYQTNMATSYAAGRYQQMSDPEVLKLHPYWRYIHSSNVLNPREQHLQWHGLTLPADHPFFKTHFAPNGFGCQCRITSVTRAEGEASARAGLGEPPAGWDAIDPKTGEQVGIGKSFGYAPGANVRQSLQSMTKVWKSACLGGFSDSH
jgi:hypothetical protein